METKTTETITPRMEYPSLAAKAKPLPIRQAEKRVLEIMDQIHYATSCLTHDLVKAYKAGMTQENGEYAYGLITQAISESRGAWLIAVAQPEQKPAIRPRVEL